MSLYPGFWSRRRWVHAAMVGGVLGRSALGSFLVDDAIDQIQARAREARMQPFESSTTTHFHAVGDAPAQYRADALSLCENFAADYFAHFRAKGFTLEWPTTRLPVVILANPTSYAAFERDFADAAVGGHFDLANNWLVTFDFRSLDDLPRNPGAGDPRLDNTLALVHEVFHQLSFNTGMLGRLADLPLCLSEGLAEYAETWRPARRDIIGSINRRRRLAVEQELRKGNRWIGLKELFTQDELQDDPKTAQLARGESWLLAYRLLKSPERLKQLHNYLRAIPPGAKSPDRADLAARHFGDLSKLDQEIRH